jgi:hypothetical protein
VKSSTTTNAAPTANAGADKTITLPTSSLYLYGSASDSDGSIASTTWTKVNGPSCSMSGTTTLKLGLSKLVAGTYTFRLTAKDNAGATKYDDVIVKVNSSTTTALGAPSNLAGKVNSYKTAVGLSWSDNSSSESGFEIYMSVGNNTSYKVVGSTSYNKTAYTVGISASQTYYFKMRAKNSTGYSAYSNEIKIVNGTNSTTTSTSNSESTTDTYSLSAPSSLTHKVNPYKTGVGLSWKDNSSNESNFEIYMSTGNTSSFKLVGKTSSNKTTYTVGISAGQTYYIKMRAVNSSGHSAFSNQVTVTTSLTSTASIASPEEETSLTQVAAYPNPATDFVDIRFGSEFEGEVNVQLIDLSGRVLHRETVNTTNLNATRIDLRDKAMINGMYVIRLDNGQTQKSIKLLKR